MSRHSTSEKKISKGSLSRSTTKSDGTSENLEALGFPQITRIEDVITNFFNQIVQYVIDDMIVVEKKEETDSKKSTTADIIKDYKDLKPEDLVNNEIKSASGSKVTLSKKSSSRSVGKKEMHSSILGTIPEETALSKSSTCVSSSALQDPLMEEECQVKIIFTNGNIYEGWISKRIMNGKGRFLWTDGTIYEGEFKDGFPTGNGVVTLPDLSRYEGEFYQGLFNGRGFLNIVSTPTFYSGEWKNGQKHGQGWLLYEPGDWYEGSWADDLKDGFGVRYYKNGAKYRGMWRKGNYDGNGIMIWENNDYYKGQWVEGLMHGEGEYIWKAFYNNTFAFPIQTIYKGSWKYGKRSGEGTMVFGDDTGLKLKGEWDRDFKHGDGYLVCGNGRVYHDHSLFQYDKPLQLECSVWSIKSTPFYRLLDLPIFTAPENVDVGYYVEQLLGKLHGVSMDKLKILKSYEEKHIKNVITRNLPQLRELYQDYARIAAKTKLHYQPVMIRLFLWQLYKDKEISKIGISLAEIDQILADHPRSCVDTVHNPFEPIYFWQFLMSLIGVALSTSSLEETYDNSLQGGVSAFLIKKFFEEIIFTKETDNQNSLILNYLDVAPINSVYLLYQKIGEPHTARTFLKESCTRKGEVPLLCHLDLFLKKNEPHLGTNLVPLDQYVTFEKHDGIEIDQGIKHNWTNLLDFRHLGPRNIVKCLAKSCPLIIVDDLVVKMDYPLTFMEFYETLLYCIFMVLELEMKTEEKILWQSVPIPPTRVQSASSKTKSVKSAEAKKNKEKGKKADKKKKKRNA